MTPATPAGKRNEPRRFYEALEMSDRRLLLVALAVSLLVAGVIALKIHDLTTSLGDTDDAMRLVRVRELNRERFVIVFKILGRSCWLPYEDLILSYALQVDIFPHVKRVEDMQISRKFLFHD